MKRVNKFMKKLLGIMFLGLLLITPSQADDIRDFQIEGLSIGDSALDFASREAIEAEKKSPNAFYPNSKKFFTAAFKNIVNSEIYDGIQFELKTKDKKYIIYSLMGQIFFKNNIKGCYEKQDEIAEELSDLFKNATREDRGITKHGWDKSGKSTRRVTLFWFKDTEDYVKLVCFDWSEEMKTVDGLGITINSEEFAEFLRNEAY